MKVELVSDPGCQARRRFSKYTDPAVRFATNLAGGEPLIDIDLALLGTLNDAPLDGHI